jgi:hypothetical protein
MGRLQSSDAVTDGGSALITPPRFTPWFTPEKALPAVEVVNIRLRELAENTVDNPKYEATLEFIVPASCPNTMSKPWVTGVITTL